MQVEASGLRRHMVRIGRGADRGGRKLYPFDIESVEVEAIRPTL